jgi:type II secretory pathway pseudopilin PulG
VTAQKKTMMKPLTTHSKPRQQGVVLLLLMLVVFVAGSSVVIAALNNRQRLASAKRTEVLYQLEQAKAQLLAYAANYATLHDNTRGPGFFPCPDTDDPAFDDSGAADAQCDSDAPLIGRLPAYDDNGNTRFPFNDAYADIDQQPWLIVAPRYVYYSQNDARRRSDTRAFASSASTRASDYWLALDGTRRYVALLIAPGEALDMQDRARGRTNFRNYLDGRNGSDGFDFHSSYRENPQQFNDIVVGITVDEYMLHTGTAVARAMKTVLDAYHANVGEYPRRNRSSANYTQADCGNTAFSNAFENATYNGTHRWLRDASAGNGNTQEQWSCRYGAYWTRANANTGTLSFPGCAGLSFTFTYRGGVARNGYGC